MDKQHLLLLLFILWGKIFLYANDVEEIDYHIAKYQNRLKTITKNLEQLLPYQKNGLKSIKSLSAKKKILQLELKKLKQLQKIYQKKHIKVTRERKIKAAPKLLIKPSKATTKKKIPQAPIQANKHYLELANVYQSQGKLNYALEAYKKAIKEKKALTPFTMYKMARVYEKNGLHQKAKEFYGKAAKSPIKTLAAQAKWELQFLQWQDQLVQDFPSLKPKPIVPLQPKVVVKKSKKVSKKKRQKKLPVANYLPLEEKKKRIKRFLKEINVFRSKLLGKEQKLVANLNALQQLKLQTPLPQVEQAIAMLEQFEKGHQFEVELAAKALNTPLHARLNKTMERLKKYLHSSKKSKRLIVALNKANAEVLLYKNSYQKLPISKTLKHPQLGQWFYRLNILLQRLKKQTASGKMVKIEMALYTSRIENYLQKFKNYPQEIASLVQELRAIKASVKDKTNLAFNTFVKDSVFVIDIESEIVNLLVVIEQLEKKHTIKSFKSILQSLQSVHKKYKRQFQTFTQKLIDSQGG